MTGRGVVLRLAVVATMTFVALSPVKAEPYEDENFCTGTLTDSEMEPAEFPNHCCSNNECSWNRNVRMKHKKLIYDNGACEWMEFHVMDDGCCIGGN